MLKRRAELKTIPDDSGAPAYVVIPVAEYAALVSKAGGNGKRRTMPREVVSLVVDGCSPARAWREHRGLTQAQVARRMGISQPALAQIEVAERPRKATRMRLATALQISPEQLTI